MEEEEEVVIVRSTTDIRSELHNEEQHYLAPIYRGMNDEPKVNNRCDAPYS